jgi:hypothetical protein
MQDFDSRTPSPKSPLNYFLLFKIAIHLFSKVTENPEMDNMLFIRLVEGDFL